MLTTLIRNVTIINEGQTFKGSVLIKGELIEEIYEIGKEPKNHIPINIIEGENKILIPGVIDDQVHFRQPGLTHKGDILTESRSAVAGGVTSFMEMPNTNPQTITQDLLEQKNDLGSKFSLANFSFYIGATNDNLNELLKTDPTNVCGIKVFMGSSTGNMLVDDPKTLEGIFKEASLLVAVHCEDEPTIQRNIERYRKKYHDNIPIDCHPLIRSSEACFKSSEKAVNLASKYNTRLHVLHLSTEKEMGLFKNTEPLKNKRITSEVCIHHLWFCDKDYAKFGSRIKWNPAIKTEDDRNALWKALLDDHIDIVATDHAPHTLLEKENPYLCAPSGGPLIQHSLVAMLEFYKNGKISIEKIVEKMCHAPAEIFKIDKRGYIRTGYYADLVLVDMNSKTEVNKENILYKCGWSPFEGVTFSSSVTNTFVNGSLVYENGMVNDHYRGKRLQFNR